MTKWGLTIDCARPGAPATFWALALGYEAAPDPAGTGPTLSFLEVPEGNVARTDSTSTAPPTRLLRQPRACAMTAFGLGGLSEVRGTVPP